MSIDRYIDCLVTIVYMDRHRRITQRDITIKAVRDGYVKAHCLKSKGPRIFAVDNILAYQPVSAKSGRYRA
ncbi:hypothetical protein [Paenibacillus sacheonensis]|uniref:WYL domain-containing protein n=1 Tax=Paenibacillus sacheonensis TaxID=742054 RepID=A0A7X5BVS3_9BACL|nr:hypothetical protein [Paenibacillus sacheonensis]MBM7566048.1 putative DNA-binding transcriptional regulator YafY [Paenibacillus sacheonensis]NBC68643.1 hypothetical protein [Paenibacillus sacheonensis]